MVLEKVPKHIKHPVASEPKEYLKAVSQKPFDPDQQQRFP